MSGERQKETDCNETGYARIRMLGFDVTCAGQQLDEVFVHRHIVQGAGDSRSNLSHCGLPVLRHDFATLQPFQQFGRCDLDGYVLFLAECGDIRCVTQPGRQSGACRILTFIVRAAISGGTIDADSVV